MSSASLINIRPDVDDVYYRYKMPSLVSKIEGRGNGIKTVVLNLQDVSRSLVRPPLYILKYFGNEVGAQIISDDKTSRYILTGVHSVDSLQNILYTFIKRFVLCGSCLNPETDLSVTKDEIVTKVCKACGKTTLADMRHKLASFIVKNPPESFTISTAEAEEVLDDDIIREEDFDMANLSIQSGEDFEVSLESDSVLHQADHVAMFAEELQQNFDLDSVKKAIKRLAIPKYIAVAVFAQTVFNEDILKGEIQRYAPIIQFLTQDEERSELALLGATERIVAIHHPSLITKTHAIFAAFYQLMLVSEESFIFWNEHISKRFVDRKTGLRVREAAKPFFDWLMNAVEEEDDEEEDSNE